MPPKKTKYPRYFRNEDPKFQDCIVVFPEAGSLGTAYYPGIKVWAKPQWRLSEMSETPADVEITELCANKWQKVAFGIPDELPPFKAEGEDI